jgi:methenyltetrahydromethanopterin cyclohydrolase
MHLNLHKKAYKKALLIANGYEAYHDEISHLAESVHYIDPYSQKKNYIQSLETFKNYLEHNNLDSESTKIIYGSGLEDKLSIQKYLDDEFCIAGNSFSKYRYLSNIYNLDRIIFDENISLPETSNSYHYKFLSKKHNSSGGMNVGNNTFSNNAYYQKYLPGKTYSISFIADGEDSKILGLNQLFLVKDNIRFPFLHSGAMNLGLSEANIDFPKKFICNLCNFYQMKGYCSIDFKIVNKKIYILDLNPRLSSSYRLYTRKYENLMHHHLGLISNKVKMVSDQYYAYIILYAKKDLVISDSINELDNISDRPTIGDFIKKDMPLFTINLHSYQKDDLLSKIKNRIMSAMKIIDCYNTELEYE